ncbi:DUF551 domain-containing protein [Escherichia coli]|uniref:DUF551 domain-containing protein n=1 Tax=Escherichia coli TaxID=562 RepID=UPI000FC0F565|nr:DUF551 domain-containing protein [Escherichia coli]HBC2931901.1 DUF551 domain-containing protein [Escherichia coli O146]EED0554188.1 DUF551 domain-containing protein [Escherichia coli]EED1847775.1 DUF551 domain-containing protein [Escherichia coli]EER3513962.1 DUF551 domain-containing protein [Escherichia coli]EEY8277752.1 DUF551 domain-containing protein [Escherichia coli]
MINRIKLEHILEYARQQRHIGQHCKIPPGDMVEIMEIAMRKAGNSPVTPDGWISCSERMPPVGVDVQLFVSSTGEQFTGFNLDNTGDFQYAQCFGAPIVCEATHWMSLPEPPKEVRQ